MLVYKKCTKRQLDSTIGEIKTLYIFFLRICVLKRSHILWQYSGIKSYYGRSSNHDVFFETKKNTVKISSTIKLVTNGCQNNEVNPLLKHYFITFFKLQVNLVSKGTRNLQEYKKIFVFLSIILKKIVRTFLNLKMLL